MGFGRGYRMENQLSKRCLESLAILFFFSCKVMSDSLRPHGLQHARLPCPLSPWVCLNLCPLSWLCYLNISSSATLVSFCLQSILASGSFPISGLSSWGDQSIGASASFLPMNVQGWFLLGLTSLISLLSKELLRDFSRSQDLLWYVHLSGGQGSLACCTPWTHRVLHNLVTEQQFI